MKITYILLFVIGLISMPLVSIIGADDEDKNNSVSQIKNAYYYDELGVMEYLGDRFNNENEELSENINFIKEDKLSDKDRKKLLKGKDDTVYITVEFNADPESMDYGTLIRLYYDIDKIDEDIADTIAAFIKDNLESAVIENSNLSDEYKALLNKEFLYEVHSDFEDLAEVDEDGDILGQVEYNITLVIICLFIFLVSFVGGKVAELIVTEKATRVMEYLLTRVKPLAVLTGKVLGASLVMFTIVADIIVSIALSLLINKSINGSYIPGLIKDMLGEGLFTGINIQNIVLILVITILGGFFYGIIAGIAGATVSKVEEMAEGMKIFTFALMIGAYLPLFMMITQMAGGDNVFGPINYFIYFFPFCSMFILPAYLLIGKVSSLIALIAAGVLIISIILMMLFVNKIYENMLYSNGAPMKLKDIIKLSRKNKEVKSDGK